jgi:hypothetical protein
MADHVLLVVDDTFDDPSAVPTTVEQELEAADDVEVLAPVIGHRLDIATADDKPLRKAQARGERVVSELEGHGVIATLRFTEDGPFGAISEVLIDHSYDKIIVAVREQENWREKRLFERLHNVTDVPVEQVVVARKG